MDILYDVNKSLKIMPISKKKKQKIISKVYDFM